MTRDSHSLADDPFVSSTLRDRTRVIPVESIEPETSRSVTQLIPVGNGGATARLPRLHHDSHSPARGTTLVLALEGHPLNTCVDAPAVAERLETPSGALQHTLIWPDIAPPPDLSVSPAVRADGHNTSSVSIEPGGITRIARPSEWLPSTELADVSMPRQGASVDPATTSADKLTRGVPNHRNDESPRSQPAMRIPKHRIFERLTSLSLHRKLFLALAPLAIGAGVYVVYPGTARPATSATRPLPAAAPLAPQQVSAATPQVMTSPSAAPQPNSTATRGHSQKTLLRQATDAIGEGNYVEARALFGRLQASEPNNHAYGSAIRIIDHELSKSQSVPVPIQTRVDSGPVF